MRGLFEKPAIKLKLPCAEVFLGKTIPFSVILGHCVSKNMLW